MQQQKQPLQLQQQQLQQPLLALPSGGPLGLDLMLGMPPQSPLLATSLIAAATQRRLRSVPFGVF